MHRVRRKANGGQSFAGLADGHDATELCSRDPDIHGEYGQPERALDFPVSMEEAVREKLRIVPADPGRVHYSYEMVAPGGRVAALNLYGRRGLAHIACAQGEWQVNKRRRLGWELVIESSHGRHVGWYSGRRWLSGGTISLTDGTQAELRRSRIRRWKLQLTHSDEPFVEIHPTGPYLAQEIELTIRSLPTGTSEGHLVILTACVVVALERVLAVPSEGGGGG